MDASNTISIREFSRRLEISDTSVHKAIKAGKIVNGLDKTDPKKPKIIFDVAMKEWGDSLAPKNPANDKVEKALAAVSSKTPLSVTPKNPGENISTPLGDTENNNSGDEDVPIKVRNSATLTEANRVASVIKARTAQLEYEELKGSLVRRKDVDREFFAVAQTVRAALQGIPDKFIDLILSGENRSESYEILVNAINRSLEELSNATKTVEL